MNYKEVRFEIHPGDEGIAEIIVALLSPVGYESFTEENGCLLAYIREQEYSPQAIDDALRGLISKGNNLSWQAVTIPGQNWNALWESNFPPVVIGNICRIRAPFHDSLPGFAYEILIEPKMSFGTGHHATTSLMISWMLELDIENKDVLDLGCGTGILAILAAKMKARSVIAIDNEEWAYTNTMENIELNHVSTVHAFLGDASLLKEKDFDIILANINLNTLSRDMSVFRVALRPKGLLLLSGFLENDEKTLLAVAASLGLTFKKNRIKNGWASILLQK